jgi:hypothetical protein
VSYVSFVPYHLGNLAEVTKPPQKLGFHNYKIQITIVFSMVENEVVHVKHLAIVQCVKMLLIIYLLTLSDSLHS